MRYRKHRTGPVSLLVVVTLGGMALASSAQAAALTFPAFYVNGSAADLPATLSAKQLGISAMLMPTLGAEINCNKFSVVEANLNSSKDANFKFLSEECAARELGGSLALLPECNIIASKSDARPHITMTGLILPTELTDGSPAILIEKLISLVLFKAGEGCPLPTDNAIKGELCGKVLKNHVAEMEVEFSQAIQGSCRLRLALEGEEGSTGVKDKVLYGVQEVFLDAKWDLFLTGVNHLGKTLGVLY